MSLIYLMGAGRSGTTILSLILGNNPGLLSMGELHQLPEHVAKEQACSCGEFLEDCSYWSQFPNELMKSFSSKTYRDQARLLESHRYVFHYFFNKSRSKAFSKYKNANRELLNLASSENILIDSAKYLGRGLALQGILDDEIKFLYLVRDPRGVVSSFEKNVQTSRNWFSASVYYLAVNLSALLVEKTLLRNKVLRLRYEDLLSNPEREIQRISGFIDRDLEQVQSKLSLGLPMETGHIIGGNRLVKKKQVTFTPSDFHSWKNKLPKWKQVVVWFITAPLNIINGYKL